MSCATGTPLTVQLLVTGTMVSPWPPSTIARTSLTATPSLAGQEQLEAPGVEHARHADHALAREPGHLLHLVDHRVQRVRDDDHERARALGLQVLGDAADDLQIDGQQIVARHARLARHAGGDDHDIGAGAVVPVRRAGDLGVVAQDRAVLFQIQRLALGDAFLVGNVEQDDVAQLATRDQRGQFTADVAGTDERDFLAGHGEDSEVKGWDERTNG